MKKPERMIIFMLNWMGDILFSFQLLRAIRKTFPDIYITCVVVPRYADLLTNNPWINSVHALSDSNKITSLGDKMAFVRMIRKEGYDTCLLLKPSSMKTAMAVLAGIPERVGFAGKKTSLTKEVEMPKGNIHRADQILMLAGVFGVTEADGTYEYFSKPEERDRANVILHNVKGGVKRMVALNPGGNWIAKRWPVENFISLGKKLLDRFDDIEVMIPGAAKDVKYVGGIVKEIGSGRCYAVAGQTDLKELGVLFEKCDLVVSADSGPLHLASATGTTTIGIFGPTSREITGPRGKGRNIVIQKSIDCVVPCYAEECEKDYKCMRSVTVDEVFNAAEEVLAS